MWAYRRYKKKKSEQGEDKTPQRVTPNAPAREPIKKHSPIGDMLDTSGLPSVLREALEERFPNAWPPDDATVNEMADDPEAVIVFAVKSEHGGNYTETREELITAKVLSVEKTLVRARIIGEVAHAEHHGSHAGHGFRRGDLVEVPRAKILVAARSLEPKLEGYDSEGPAAQTLKPSTTTQKVYKVRPDTPYDLVLPYRTDELEWHIEREHVTMVKLGEHGLLEQVKFSEDSMRGPVTIRALDNDPKEGFVLVGRWQLEIAA